MNDKQLQDRLVRIESRLVQIMLHLGMNPYEKMYDDNHSNKYRADTATPGHDSPGSEQDQGKP